VKRAIQVALQGTGAVTNCLGTLLSDTQDVASFTSSTEQIALPAGHYSLATLDISVSPDKKATPGAEENTLWRYQFSPDGVDGKMTYPIAVSEKGTEKNINPVGKPIFTAAVQKEAKAGDEISVQLKLATDTGLYLTNCVRPGQEYGTEDYAKISLVSPEGKSVSQAGSGFA
jgi:hypothetical protein